MKELLGNQDLSITTGNSALPKPLLEEELQFSKARLSDQNAAKTLGVANLVGVLWLGSALTKFLRLAEAGSVGGLGPSSFAFLQLVSKVSESYYTNKTFFTLSVFILGISIPLPLRCLVQCNTINKVHVDQERE